MKYKLLKERTGSGFTHIMARNSAYGSLIPELNNFILRCREAGLFIILEWDLYTAKYKMHEILMFLDNNPEAILPKKLTMEILQAPFWFLCIGTLLATCIFLLEILCSFVQRIKGLIIIII